MSDKNMIKRRTSEPMLTSYLNRKGCALGIPVTGNFELTARCNFNCKMCYVHSMEEQNSLIKRELSTDQWLGLASDARDAGLLFLLLTGGEPFIREDFEIIYRELIKMGFVISINTNGSLYNENLRRLFMQYPPTRINVTLYGGSEETYQSLCGNASFEKVVNNLRSMKADQLQVRLNISFTPYNVNDMEKIDSISKDIGLQAKASSYMYPPARINGQIGYNHGRFGAEEAGRIMARWDKLRESDEQFQARAEIIQKQHKKEEADGVEIEQEGVRCRAGRSSFWITWEGDMLPCGTMNVPPAKPLETGFQEAWEQTRKATALIRLPKECSICSMRNYCGVCAAVCKGETGCFDKKPEYLCALTKARCEETLKLANERR